MGTKIIVFFALVSIAALATDTIEDDDITFPPILAPFMNAHDKHEESATNLEKRFLKLIKATRASALANDDIQPAKGEIKNEEIQKNRGKLEEKSHSLTIIRGLENDMMRFGKDSWEAAGTDCFRDLMAPTEEEVKKRVKQAIDTAINNYYEKVSQLMKTKLLQAMFTDDHQSLFEMGSEPLRNLFSVAGLKFIEHAGKLIYVEENPSIMVAEPVNQSGWQRFVTWLKSLFGIKPQETPLPQILSVPDTANRACQMGDRIQAHFQAKDEFFREVYELYQPFHNMFAVMAVQVDKLLSADIEPQDDDTPDNLEKYYKKISDNLFHGLAWLPVLAKYRRGRFDFDNPDRRWPIFFRKISRVFEFEIGNWNHKLTKPRDKIKKAAYWRLFWDFIAFLGEADQGIALRVVNEVFSCAHPEPNRYSHDQKVKIVAELIQALPSIQSLANNFSRHALFVALAIQSDGFTSHHKIPEFSQRARDVGKYVSIEHRPILSAARVSKLMYARTLLNRKGYQMFDLLGLVKVILKDAFYEQNCGLKLFAFDFDHTLDQSLTDNSLPQAMRDNYVALKLLNLWSVDSRKILEKVVFQAPKDETLYAKWAESLAKIDPSGNMLEVLTLAIKDIPAAQASGMSAEQKVKLLAGVELSLEQAHEFEPELSKLFLAPRHLRNIRI